MTPATFHPVIEILIRHFHVTSEALAPYHDSWSEPGVTSQRLVGMTTLRLVGGRKPYTHFCFRVST